MNTTTKEQTMNTQELAAALSAAMTAANVPSNDSSIMGGVSVQKFGNSIEITGTDGSWLTVSHLQDVGGTVEPLILKSKDLPALIKLLRNNNDSEVKSIGKVESAAQIELFDGTVFNASLIDGVYPRYQEMFPRDFRVELSVNVAELRAAVQAVLDDETIYQAEIAAKEAELAELVERINAYKAKLKSHVVKGAERKALKGADLSEYLKTKDDLSYKLKRASDDAAILRDRISFYRKVKTLIWKGSKISASKGTAETVLTLEENVINVCFDAKLIKRVLGTVKTETVTVKYNQALKPVVFEHGSNSILVMPVQLR